ncbi:hypothetical protein A2926_02090 [Candidatus Giovannonibacteria bacterium RIFCSPLOWO2_01_FULL_44_40]|uniref:Uncharacterized protein n=1 Tax=Candidatus Giovannonibacteria bacterium RIFCSPHIGHO2_01_FULL_45_23 TaxID=1798325 RepID=A0A1F5VFF2_9BACT|nr:MAG: hypothetical protein A2834_02210 [Candidatus Giovannonibacteria bacterium RIFCSPHIGHO2_01_FULL_45_23]OGF80359.1 MAG: hypothetical protein A2926_02090 [Candidatus Giovannonibacteria bacterium RIFCSPLOWO2_01_FULL_44_40]
MPTILTKRNICKISISLLGFSFLLIFSLFSAQTAHAQFDSAPDAFTTIYGGGLTATDYLDAEFGAEVLGNTFALDAFNSVSSAVNFDIGSIISGISESFSDLSLPSGVLDSISFDKPPVPGPPIDVGLTYGSGFVLEPLISADIISTGPILTQHVDDVLLLENPIEYALVLIDLPPGFGAKEMVFNSDTGGVEIVFKREGFFVAVEPREQLAAATREISQYQTWLPPEFRSDFIVLSLDNANRLRALFGELKPDLNPAGKMFLDTSGTGQDLVLVPLESLDPTISKVTPGEVYLHEVGHLVGAIVSNSGLFPDFDIKWANIWRDAIRDNPSLKSKYFSWSPNEGFAEEFRHLIQGGGIDDLEARNFVWTVWERLRVETNLWQLIREWHKI